jgi:hypothetical protein
MADSAWAIVRDEINPRNEKDPQSRIVAHVCRVSDIDHGISGDKLELPRSSSLRRHTSSRLQTHCWKSSNPPVNRLMQVVYLVGSSWV